MLPMRRDTRSKLQKIAAEAGLIAKPAATEVSDFYVYENWLAGPHKVVLHRSNCGQCNHGKGASHRPRRQPRALARPIRYALRKRARRHIRCQEY